MSLRNWAGTSSLFVCCWSIFQSEDCFQLFLNKFLQVTKMACHSVCAIQGSYTIAKTCSFLLFFTFYWRKLHLHWIYALKYKCSHNQNLAHASYKLFPPGCHILQPRPTPSLFQTISHEEKLQLCGVETPTAELPLHKNLQHISSDLLPSISPHKSILD